MSSKLENINREDSIYTIRIDSVGGISEDSVYLSSDSDFLSREDYTQHGNITVEPEQHFFAENTQKSGTNLPITLSGSDGLFFLFLVSFLLLSFSFREIVSFMREKLVLAVSPSRNEKLYENTVTTKDTFNLYVLMFVSILVLSLSFYYVLNTLELSRGGNSPFATIGTFIVLAVLFVFLKLMSNRLIGYVFDKQKEVKIWNFSYLILFGALGGICFIPSLFLVYPIIEYDIIIVFVLVLFLLVQINLFIRIILFFTSQGFSILFMIAYLCAVEIVPYLFLGAGMVYLYKVDIFNVVL